MAYDLKQISPLDLRKSVSIGVKIPFDAPNVFTRVFTTKDQTKYNLINFLMTDKRERIFAPNFGAGLRRKIFEQISQNTVEEIQQSIITQIQNYFANVEIQELSVTGTPSNNVINIKLSYRLINTNENDIVIISIEN